MNPLVSVITPVLNSEETIEIHMDSIANQNSRFMIKSTYHEQ